MYQPPWQHNDVLEKIIHECYDWTSLFLSKQDPKRFRVTINISASLTEQLQKKSPHVLQQLARAAQKGVVEFTDTAAYHAILPLFLTNGVYRPDVVQHQIMKDRAVNRAAFGSWNPQGFFPPELAFSSRLARVLQQMNYSWSLTESVVYEAHHKPIPSTQIALNEELPVLFRSDDWSNKFSGSYAGNVKGFVNDIDHGILSWFNRGYAILAYDLETIGHHHKNYNKEQLEEYVTQLEQHNLRAVHASTLTTLFPLREPIERPLQGSWSTAKNTQCENPWPRWHDPDNKHHTAYWWLIRKILAHTPAENLDVLAPALHSCPTWWVSGDRFESDKFLLGADMLRFAAEQLGVNVTEEYCAVVRSLYET